MSEERTLSTTRRGFILGAAGAALASILKPLPAAAALLPARRVLPKELEPYRHELVGVEGWEWNAHWTPSLSPFHELGAPVPIFVEGRLEWDCRVSVGLSPADIGQFGQWANDYGGRIAGLTARTEPRVEVRRGVLRRGETIHLSGRAALTDWQCRPRPPREMAENPDLSPYVSELNFRGVGDFLKVYDPPKREPNFAVEPFGAVWLTALPVQQNAPATHR